MTLPPIQIIEMPDGSVLELVPEATLTPEEMDEGIAILRELADRQDAEKRGAA